MGDELSGLLEIFTKVKEAGGQATLTATTSEGKTKLKLEIVSSPSATAPPPLQPVPGQARRRLKQTNPVWWKNTFEDLSAFLENLSHE